MLYFLTFIFQYTIPIIIKIRTVKDHVNTGLWMSKCVIITQIIAQNHSTESVFLGSSFEEIISS